MGTEVEGASRVRLGPRWVGEGRPVFVVAEVGVNHNGDLRLAERLVDAAVRAGADAVKFQAFDPERLATPHAPAAPYQRRGEGERRQLGMLRRLALGESALRRLARRARARGLLFLASAFDEGSADLLGRLGVAAYKIPSGEVTNLPLLSHMARKGRPLILSTGMATLAEVGEALETIGSAGNRRLVLLHCNTAYPTRPEDVNLRAMLALRSFGHPVGYSDHTLGPEAALAAVALGACLIEKHFTLDRSLPGPDHKASEDPLGLLSLVEGIRRVERMLGKGEKGPTPSERPNIRAVRKSVVAQVAIPRGVPIRREWLAVKRPGTGLPPKHLPDVVGRRARVDLAAGRVIRPELIEGLPSPA